MKTKLFIIGLMLLLAGSCAPYSPRYLPSDDKIDVNEHGSYIKIKTISENPRKPNYSVTGELIAIDTTAIIVLDENKRICIAVPIDEIDLFVLRYALPKSYVTSMILFPLTSLLHGYYALLTLPMNILVTAIVTTSGHTAFQYNDENISYRELRMFARFPQGIPPNVDTANLE